MAITAQMVKELRERTGAGMMECKKALTQTNGDLEAAIEEMRKSGLAKAAKKAGRVAAEGIIATSLSADKKAASIVEVNSETDFVARENAFVKFAQDLADLALAHKLSDIEALLNTDMGNDKTAETVRAELVAKIGENIQVRRVAYVESTGVLGDYLHGSRIGVLASLSNDDGDLARDIAMHVAATRPDVIKPEDVAEDMIEKEKEIFIAQARESGKADDIIEKMVGGRIKKFLNEISLHGQAFVKNPDQTVAQLLQSKGAEVHRFVRFEVGEGIEKEVVDFAEEVKAQAQGK
ncbi:MAG: elongation factor Ts [Gammaproteobacteria bacterium CG11_big_fil_rev_8_21_14_0_20_46_22]|nr:MAG: elongation factor Ts [Gammaproteobacteria bacterium CG12_big_fil_rev_8_21_14_0_65_46_12]PIR11373.1 MAG: elongation factor Ts [Gammaproteobacteria bacterium CG11_big_fil_rev_8_21_14_0_20_46_22]